MAVRIYSVDTHRDPPRHFNLSRLKFSRRSTSVYPSQSPDAFPAYLVEITAGSANAAATCEIALRRMATAAMSTSIPIVTSGPLLTAYHGSMDSPATMTGASVSNASISTAIGTTTSMMALSSSSAAVMNADSSADNSNPASSGAITGPQMTGAANAKNSCAGTTALISILCEFLSL